MSKILNQSGEFLGRQIDQVTEFLGIRYATANRFEEPKDISKYAQIVDAIKFGAQSPQVPGFMDEILNTKDLSSSEDCLFLNIWKPSDSHNSLPVLFWIHGGAFTNGTAATSWYNGVNLVKQGNVVLVSINYRLGPFGFMGENNLGILDQISALRWVQRNISSFGGDPNNVTIFGESAGGSSVVALTASTQAHQLFAKGWAMSPSLLQLRSKSAAKESQQKFLDAAKCSSVDELRSLSTQQLIDATALMFLDAENYITTFSPTCGGTALPVDVYEASAKSGKPLVIGTNRDENRLWSALNADSAGLTEPNARIQFEKVFGESAEKAWQLYSLADSSLTPSQMVSAMQTDQNFRLPAWRLSEIRSAHTPTWMYWFTWPSPVFNGVLGCCHALDLPFMFNNLDKPNVEMFTGADPVRQTVSDHFTSELLSFARSGITSWPQYETSVRSTLRIDVEIEKLNDPDAKIREIWAHSA
jgi:para-nitrobenzyl esterase